MEKPRAPAKLPEQQQPMQGTGGKGCTGCSTTHCRERPCHMVQGVGLLTEQKEKKKNRHVCACLAQTLISVEDSAY